MTGSCPVPHGPASGAGDRRSTRPGEPARPDVERVDGVWHVRSQRLVREVLRSADATRQAGFGVETVRAGLPLTRWPVLYADGEEHRTQRAKIGRYFSPAVVNREYRELMAAEADALVGRLDDGLIHDLSDLALHFSTRVAARVVGLTESDQEGLARRLVAFFDQPDAVLGDPATGWRRLTAFAVALPGALDLLRFHLADVRPAIRARRTQRRDDVVSHLLDEGYSEIEVLMECVTYGAAGMVTTRELLQMAAWHLLDRPALRERFLAAPGPERQAILLEVLRLEPVVGHLYRRAAQEIDLTDDAGTHHRIPAGARLDLAVRPANADPEAVGEGGLCLRPDRELPRGVRPEVMSFGDGAHRCPGNTLALVETELFLERLLAKDVRLVSTPRIEWEEIIAGYAVRDLRLQLA